MAQTFRIEQGKCQSENFRCNVITFIGKLHGRAMIGEVRKYNDLLNRNNLVQQLKNENTDHTASG